MWWRDFPFFTPPSCAPKESRPLFRRASVVAFSLREFFFLICKAVSQVSSHPSAFYIKYRGEVIWAGERERLSITITANLSLIIQWRRVEGLVCRRDERSLFKFNKAAKKIAAARFIRAHSKDYQLQGRPTAAEGRPPVRCGAARENYLPPLA